MFDLTGRPLFVIAVLGAIALPVVAAVLWTHASRPGATPRPHQRLRAVGRLLALFLAQALACLALFLHVNNVFGFYASWDDLLGIGGQGPARVSAQGVDAGQGRFQAFPIRGAAARGDVLVWLPPGYDDPANAQVRYPVVMFLPGVPSTPANLNRQFDVGAQASKAILSMTVKPFIVVMPPAIIAPPRDTECMDVPRGPQAESWLVRDVVDGIVRGYRAVEPGPQWSLMGWSTGGICSTKIALRFPTRFGAAVSIGGDSEPYIDNTTGDLFGGSQQLRNENTATWLYKQHKTRGVKLLLIAGKQDRSSWPSTQKLVNLAKGDPNVSLLTFPTGGHNLNGYRPLVPQMFAWLQRVRAFG